MNLDQIYFDAATGTALHRFQAAPVVTAQRFIAGLHFIQFEHWTLRWLYFLAGLAGCVTIATGFLFWLEARRARHAKKGLAGVRMVEGLAVGSVTGMIIATLAFFIANRLLPLEMAGRAGSEMWAFYLAWIAAFTHAWLRPRRAWREQAVAIAGLAMLAVALNALTTGDHLLRTLAQGRWAVAGMDLMLLAAAAVAASMARRLHRGCARASMHSQYSRCPAQRPEHARTSRSVAPAAAEHAAESLPGDPECVRRRCCSQASRQVG